MVLIDLGHTFLFHILYTYPASFRCIALLLQTDGYVLVAINPKSATQESSAAN